MKKLTFLLLASIFFTGMQAQDPEPVQEPEPVQLSDTTYTYNVVSGKMGYIYCTLSDGTKLFFANNLDTAYSASGYFYLTLLRIESDQPTLSIPGNYVYRGYRTSLKRVTIPQEKNYQCDFQEITVPDGTEVFYLPSSDNALTTLNLPPTTVCFNFKSSDKFTDLYLHSVYPPYWGEMRIKEGLYKPMSGSLENVTLHVPAMAMDLYAQTEPYKNANLVALEEPVSHVFVGYQPDITIQNTEGLAEDARLTIPRYYQVSKDRGFYHPDYVSPPIALHHNNEDHYSDDGYNGDTQGSYYTYPAQLTMDAEKPVKLKKFRLEQDCGQYLFYRIDKSGSFEYRIIPSTAIFNSLVTAEEIEMTYRLGISIVRWKGNRINSNDAVETGSSRRIHFVSFPFDVRLSDISFPPLHDKCNMEVICMEYDGGKRATVASDGYWRQLSKDEVLHANRGYLIVFHGQKLYDTKAYYNTQTTLHVKAMDTGNKQQIFTNDDVSVPLTAYPSKYKHRQGWNLIGNPYPCFFDIRHLDFYAFSPVDDEYYLYPNEAFFVQCPDGVSSVTFKQEGRLHNDPGGLWNNTSSRIQSRRQMPEYGSARRVYNFLLNGEDGYDRTRVVINEEASADYELERDAAKMMGQGGPQLYVQDGGVQYAIDERPLGDGTFTLCMVFPSTGTYALSLKDNPDKQTPVWLTDLLTGIETDLTQSAYTFDAAAGAAADRFSVRIGAKMPTSVQDVSEHSGEPVYYDLQGRIVTEPSAMQKGVYILKQGQTARKIVK